MPIRMTGMVSGLDTDSIVKELVSAYSTKKEKYDTSSSFCGKTWLEAGDLERFKQRS